MCDNRKIVSKSANNDGIVKDKWVERILGNIYDWQYIITPT